MRYATALLLFTVPVWAQKADLQRPIPAELPCEFGVTGARVIDCSDGNLCVHYVLPGSPAAEAGLRKGDRILSSPPFELADAWQFGRFIRSHVAGSLVPLVFMRDGDSLRADCEVTDIRSLFSVMSERDESPAVRQTRRSAASNARQDGLESTLRELIGQVGAVDDFEVIESEIAAVLELYGDDCRLDYVRRALDNPLDLARIAGDIAREVRSARSAVETLIACASQLDLALLELPPQPTPPADFVSSESSAPDALDDLLVEIAYAAGSLASSAFESLSTEDRRNLLRGAPSLLDAFSENVALEGSEGRLLEQHVETIRLAKRVRLERLVAAGRVLGSIAEPDARKALKRAASRLDIVPDAEVPVGFEGRFRYVADTEWGWILIGDSGPNVYGDAAVIIDLGGDDVYLDGGATPVRSQRESGLARAPVSLIIDYDGDDRYIGNRMGSSGSGFGGVGFLVDLEGDDLYQGHRLTQGSAFCGLGVLWDVEGDDVYMAQEFAQGCAFFGVGMVLDEDGDDLYSSGRFSQAFGSTSGFGLLRDLAGEDRYHADGKEPSAYGTLGVFQGWSQGVGCGIRGYGSGGIGLLLDHRGADRYRAGNFAQGTGYFFGLGILVDDGGDDTYTSSRYGQGAAAHQAAGALLDAAGNDRYVSRTGAGQGAAWDAAVGILRDLSGNDTYRANSFSQGAAALAGVAVLLDDDGRDDYRTTSGQGLGTSRSACGTVGATNLGALVDLGGQADSFSLNGRADGTRFKGAGVGLFLDR